MKTPIVTAAGKLAQLRYELPQRVLDAAVYPTKAANGSTIVLYAHETGVGILWRGGRPLKHEAPSAQQPKQAPKVNGISNDAIMIIDSDDDEPAQKAASAIPEAQFEQDEEELDPDQPYPSIVQDITLSLNTQVMHIAVPQVPAPSALRAGSIPPIFSSHMVFTVVCADSTVRVITMPLNPPPHSAKEKPLGATSQFGEQIVKFHAHQSITRGIDMTWTSSSDPSSKYESDDDMEVDYSTAGATPGPKRHQHSRPRAAVGFELLVATHSAELGGLLKLWRLGLTDTAVDSTHPIPYKTLTLRKPASRIAFNSAQYPNRRHSQLLIADLAGSARIYDPFAAVRKRSASGTQAEPGAFIATFRSTFESTQSSQYIPAVLATRKPILDAAWVTGGRHIFALLGDGEWGVWDVDRSGPSPPKDPCAFSLRGFVGTSEKDTGSGASSPKRSSRSSLAPMTPNTRRRKEDHLFHGSPAPLPVPIRGGISVASLNSTSSAAPEDSVVIWYGTEVHRIADLTKFWTRTAAAASGQSLPGPGLTQITDLALHGESISSLKQFDTTLAASRMAVARDVLIAAEHRLVIACPTAAPMGRESAGLFATAAAARDDDSRSADQALLRHGELDLGGMDRLLDDMGGEGASGSGIKTLSKATGTRRVLFASSAS